MKKLSPIAKSVLESLGLIAAGLETDVVIQ